MLKTTWHTGNGPLLAWDETNLLVAVHEDNTELGGLQTPPTFHLCIVTRADVLNVDRNAGILGVKVT